MPQAPPTDASRYDWIVGEITLEANLKDCPLEVLLGAITRKNFLKSPSGMISLGQWGDSVLTGKFEGHTWEDLYRKILEELSLQGLPVSPEDSSLELLVAKEHAATIQQLIGHPLVKVEGTVKIPARTGRIGLGYGVLPLHTIVKRMVLDDGLNQEGELLYVGRGAQSFPIDLVRKAVFLAMLESCLGKGDCLLGKPRIDIPEPTKYNLWYHGCHLREFNPKDFNFYGTLHIKQGDKKLPIALLRHKTGYMPTPPSARVDNEPYPKECFIDSGIRYTINS